MVPVMMPAWIRLQPNKLDLGVVGERVSPQNNVEGWFDKNTAVVFERSMVEAEDAETV